MTFRLTFAPHIVTVWLSLKSDRGWQRNPTEQSMTHHKALAKVIWNPSAYVAFDVSISMAAAERDPHVARLFAEQPERRSEQLAAYRIDASQRAREFRARLLSSLFMVIAACSLGLLVGALSGAVGPTLPFAA